MGRNFLFVGMLGVAVAGAEPAGARRLYDLRKVAVSAQASSCEKDFRAELAFDGDLGTRWSSEWADGQWVALDLGERREISRITLVWEAAYASDYRLEISDDGKTWQCVKTATGGRGGTEAYPFFGLRARYVRMYGVRRATGWGFSLWEFVVEGPGEGPEPEHAGLVRPREIVTLYDHDWVNLARFFADRCEADPATSAGLTDDEFLDLVERRAFDFFWYEVHPETFFVVDSTTWKARSSCAAVGLQLGAYIAGHAREYRSRAEIYDRVERLLDHCWDDPDDPHDLRWEHHEGWPYHWVDIATGDWRGDEHVCTHDAIMFFCGVICAKHYFAGTRAGELAARLLDAVKWDWILHGGRLTRFVSNCYAPTYDPPCGGEVRFYDGMKFDYLLPIGAATGAVPAHFWHNYALDFPWDSYEGHFWRIERPAPWCHQWDQLWFDFRDLRDDYADYFQNSVEATLANRQWCLDFHTYDENLWGVGPSHGPPRFGGVFYGSYGAPPDDLPFQKGTDNDGTVSPSASLGSLAFAPQEVLRVARYVYDTYRHTFWRRYGFPDALNPRVGWFDSEYVAIDVGPILLSIENYRSRLFHELFAREEQVWRGLRRAGFVGVVDNFDESEHSAPYARWSGEGPAGAFEAARCSDYVREGQRALRVKYRLAEPSAGWALVAEPHRKDFSPFAYLAFWARNAPKLTVAIRTEQGRDAPLTPVARRKERLGWSRLYYALPDVAKTANVAQVRFAPAEPGESVFWLDGIFLTHALPAEERPFVLEDGGAGLATWGAAGAGTFRRVAHPAVPNRQVLEVIVDHAPQSRGACGLVARPAVTNWSWAHSLAMRASGEADLEVHLKDAAGRAFPVGGQEIRAGGAWTTLFFNVQANLNPTNCWEPRYDKRQIAEIWILVRPASGTDRGRLILDSMYLTD